MTTLPEIQQGNMTADDVILIRRLSAMTQKQFGAEIGVCKLTVIRWESGECQPDPERVERMQKLKSDLLAMEPDAFRRHIEKVTEGE